MTTEPDRQPATSPTPAATDDAAVALAELAASATVPASRARVVLGIHPDLRGRLAELAAGRVLVVDYYTSRCCTSVLVGDMDIGWLPAEAARILPDGHVAAEPVEGVPVVVHGRLVGLLSAVEPTLRLVGPPWRRRLGVSLAEPAAWLDFLGNAPRLRHRSVARR